MREMEILKGLEGGENMAVQFVDHLLALGLRKKASDIHLEPTERTERGVIMNGSSISASRRIFRTSPSCFSFTCSGLQ